MNIERGRNWGSTDGPSDPQAEPALASDDRCAAAIFADARRLGHPVPPIVLTGGDLARTLGVVGWRPRSTSPAPGDPATGGPVTTGPVPADPVPADPVPADLVPVDPVPGSPSPAGIVRADVGAALVDGRLHWFVAHVVARRSWWKGRVLVVANAAFIGSWNIAPRSHPGDGRLEVLDAHLSTADRWRARSRLTAGTHLPHPDISQSRPAAAQFDFDPTLDVYVDGVKVRRATTLSVRLEPDALEVWL